jgi:Spy/CpxP family protein refolding chaperone
MKKAFQTLAIMLVSTFVFAQNRAEGIERIKTLKIGFITEKLKLTSEQATTFWPVYNEFDSQRMELRKETRKNIQNNSSEPTKRLDALDALRKKEHKLEDEYASKFRKVLSPEQAVNLYKVEEEFRKMLINQIQERREKK